MAWGRDPTASLLLPGERLLWSGQPVAGVRFRARDAFLIPFTVLWCGFAVFWTLGSWWMGAPIWFSAFGLIFVAVGLYITVGRFLHDAWMRRRLHYAVTDRRVLRYRGGPGGALHSIEIDRLPQLTLEDVRGDGTGTLRFEAPHMTVGVSRRSGRLGTRRRRTRAYRDDAMVPSLGRALAFLDIPDAQGVYRTVGEAARQARERSGDAD